MAGLIPVGLMVLGAVLGIVMFVLVAAGGRQPVEVRRRCRSGLHVMDEVNTYVYPSGREICRACARERARLRKMGA